MQIFYRTAINDDILNLHAIRTAVTENILSDPGRITPTDYQEMLEVNGKGWVCEVNGEIAGFAIVDMKKKIFGHCLYILILKEKVLGKSCFG